MSAEAGTFVPLLRMALVALRVTLVISVFIVAFIGFATVPAPLMAAFLLLYFVLSFIHRRLT